MKVYVVVSEHEGVHKVTTNFQIAWKIKDEAEKELVECGVFNANVVVEMHEIEVD